MAPTVFISYAREDLFAAERLYADLRDTGVIPWIDAHNLVGGQNWSLEISKAIKNSDFFIALFSQHSVTKKGFVQQEIREAIDVLKQIPIGKIFFIPVRLSPCTPISPIIAELHRIDLFPEWEPGLSEIKKAMQLRLDQTIEESTSIPVLLSITEDIDESYCIIREAIFVIISKLLFITKSEIKENMNIWELGFDSLLLMQFLSQLHNSTGVNTLSTADVFRASTLRSIILQTLIVLSKGR